jgi:hypothetical protein
MSSLSRAITFISALIVPATTFAYGVTVQPNLPVGVPNAYELDRAADRIVTRYGEFESLSHRYFTDPFYLTPYSTETHALHPYYRNTYWTRVGRRYRVSTPQFYRYLEDLYYDGYLGVDQYYQPPRYEAPRIGVPQTLCRNYRTVRPTQRTPQRVVECY